MDVMAKTLVLLTACFSLHSKRSLSFKCLMLRLQLLICMAAFSLVLCSRNLTYAMMILLDRVGLNRFRVHPSRKYPFFYRSHDLEDHSRFRIKTPNLVYLDYSSYVAQDYYLQLDSLVEAKLDLILWKYNDYIPPVDEYFGYDSTKGDAWGDATKLIAAISNVVTLHLSSDSLEVFHFCCKSMPEFNNLVKLSFESHKERGWQVLPLLLKKSPNLETLVIKGLVHEITDQCGDACVCVDEKKRNKKKKKKKKSSCCLLSCQVKVLKIDGYGRSCRELKQMRHFMENLRCLEVVKVKVQVDQQDEFLPLANDLMKLLPAASSKCNIEFI